jgi:hypothetical protein
MIYKLGKSTPIDTKPSEILAQAKPIFDFEPMVDLLHSLT